MWDGWAEELCHHMASVVAGMPLDGRFDRFVASFEPTFDWSYPGEHLELAKHVFGDYLRGQPKDFYGIGADYDQRSSLDPLYKTVKSTFELAVAVIGVAKTHPLYRSNNL